MSLDLPELESFDIGDGPVAADGAILRTGRVAAAAYTSDTRFAMERELFGKVWLCLAREEQVPAAGDWIVREVKARSVSAIIVRGRDGTVRAFHNMCSHRGMKLAWTDKGRGGRFSCPYHAWIYDAQGALVNIPDQESFPHVDKAKSGLTPIACETWEGFVFINLDPHPKQTLREFLGPVAERLAGAPFGAFRHALTLGQEVAGNWKFGMEAASEGYHVQTLHTRTIGNMLATPHNPHVHFLDWEAMGPHQTATVPGNPVFRLSAKRLVQRFSASHGEQMLVEGGMEGKASGRFLDHPAINRSGCKDFTNDQFVIFPNLSIHVTANGYWTSSYWPITKDRSIWSTTFYYRTPVSCRETFALQFAGALQRDIFAEDNGCFQRQQETLESGGRAFVQLGESEIILRYMAAVLSGLEQSMPPASAPA